MAKLLWLSLATLTFLVFFYSTTLLTSYFYPLDWAPMTWMQRFMNGDLAMSPARPAVPTSLIGFSERVMVGPFSSLLIKTFLSNASFPPQIQY
jgi:hypothetical protein